MQSSTSKKRAKSLVARRHFKRVVAAPYEQISAESTRTTARATVAMVAVAVVSAIISTFQWQAMQKSIDGSNRQAAAAEIANKIASESIIAANRPWIGLLTAVSAKPVAGQVFKATVTLKNSGHEPAINVRGILSMTMESNGEIEKRATPDCAFCSHSIVLPENALVASAEFDAGAMTPDLVEDVELGKKLILIRSSYRYVGGHGDEHATNICVVYDPKSGTFPSCETGNDAN